MEIKKTDACICVKFEIKQICRWKDLMQSGMLLMQVELITGFIADTDVLETQTDVKIFETQGRFVFIYFEGVCCNEKCTLTFFYHYHQSF